MKSVVADIVQGFIPGDGSGASHGNLGSVSYLGNDKLAVTYHRRAATTSMSSNTVSEVGVVFFWSNLTRISQVSLGDGSKVYLLKSAKYGANILIAVASSDRVSTFPPRTTAPSTDSMTLLLISPEGSILTQSTVFTPFALTASDDFEVLSDGSVVWGFVNANNNFVYYRLPVNPAQALLQKNLKIKKNNHQVLAK